LPVSTCSSRAACSTIGADCCAGANAELNTSAEHREKAQKQSENFGMVLNMAHQSAIVERRVCINHGDGKIPANHRKVAAAPLRMSR
jgi:hypothetical protein